MGLSEDIDPRTWRQEWEQAKREGNEALWAHRYADALLGELATSYRAINGVEAVLKEYGQAITYPLSDAVREALDPSPDQQGT